MKNRSDFLSFCINSIYYVYIDLFIKFLVVLSLVVTQSVPVYADKIIVDFTKPEGRDAPSGKSDYDGHDGMDLYGEPGSGEGSNGSGNGHGVREGIGEGSGRGTGKSDGRSQAEKDYEQFSNESNKSINESTSNLNQELYKTHYNAEGIDFKNADFTTPSNSDFRLGQDFDDLANGESSNGESDYITDLILDIQVENTVFTSSEKDKLNDVKMSFMGTTPQTPQQFNAKRAGLGALKQSDDAYNEGDSDTGDFYYGAALQLLSVAADFIPVTSIAKDTYGAFVGKDLFTGEELSGFDRALSGAFAVATIAGTVVTGGLGGGVVAAGMKQIDKIAKADKTALKAAEALADIAKTVPHRTKIARYGSSENIIVIGQGMDRVKQMRDALLTRGVNVKIFDATEIAPEVQTAFDNLIAVYAKEGKLVPDKDFLASLMFKENVKWIK